MKRKPVVLTGYIFALLGVVFLIESIGLSYVLSQLPFMLGVAGTFAWIYALVKFVAGALCLYYGLEQLKK